MSQPFDKLEIALITKYGSNAFTWPVNAETILWANMWANVQLPWAVGYLSEAGEKIIEYKNNSMPSQMELNFSRRVNEGKRT